jgi:hypothetical protein
MIITQAVDPCLGQTNYVEIGVAHIITFKLLDPETSNVLIVNFETIAEIRM